MTSLFPLGRTLITPAAQKAIHPDTVQALLRRHASGDWGDLSDGDKAENEKALGEDFRLFSSYNIGDQKVYIITEHDRSATTILLPSDY